MNTKITREQRHANVEHWRFQSKLMQMQGFKLMSRTAAGGKPRAYEHERGDWRVSTAPKGKWKLERFTGRFFYPPGYHYARGLKIWSPLVQRFETPLAVALWFNVLQRAGVI